LHYPAIIGLFEATPHIFALRAARSGVTLCQEAMALEQRLSRDPHLGKWFLTIAPKPVSG
jgi:hypothetical protein